MQTVPLSKLIKPILVLGILVLGYVLRGSPGDPDELFSNLRLFGTFLIFAAWMISVLSLGSCIRALVGLEGLSFLPEFAFGSAGAAWVSAILGHNGLIGYSMLPWFLLLILLPPIAELSLSKSPPLASRTSLSFKLRYANLGYGLLALIVLTRLIQAFGAHGTSDPDLYHLLGPRLWTDSGRVHFDPSHAIAYNCWAWEYLYIWGNVLLGGPQGGGLLEGQLFAQWTGVVFGTGGTALALIEIFRPLVPFPAALPLIAAAGLSSYELANFSWIAKNDWGCFFWLLAGVAFLFSRGIERARDRDIALGGLFLGLAVANKLNSIVHVGLYAVIWAVLRSRALGIRKGFRDFGLAFVFGFVALFPILLRNTLATSNPIFPHFELLIPTHLFGPTWLATIRDLGGTFGAPPSRIALRISEMILDNPFAWVLLVLPFLGFFLKNKKGIFTHATCACFGAMGYYLMDWNHPFVRWAGVTLILSGALGALILFELPRYFQKREQTLLYGIWGLLFVFLIATVPTWNAFRLSPFRISQTLILRNPALRQGAEGKAWLRMNAGAGEKIITSGDNEFYLIAHLNATAFSDNTALDQRVFDSHDPAYILDEFRSTGARYLLDSRHWDHYFWTPVARRLNRLIAAYPETVVFQGQGSAVIDLQRLEEETHSACLLPPKGSLWELMTGDSR